MRLQDIKRRMVSEFFTSSGNGCSEAMLQEEFAPAFELLQLANVSGDDYDHDTGLLAYKDLTKGTVAFAAILEGSDVLYACARNGKRLSCINFTSPTRTPRFCTLREVKEAFLEAEDRGASFKVTIGSKVADERLLQSLINKE